MCIRGDDGGDNSRIQGRCCARPLRPQTSSSVSHTSSSLSPAPVAATQRAADATTGAAAQLLRPNVVPVTKNGADATRSPAGANARGATNGACILIHICVLGEYGDSHDEDSASYRAVVFGGSQGFYEIDTHESRHTYQGAIRRSHVTHMWNSVCAHSQLRHVTRIKEVCQDIRRQRQGS